ncbi:MAG: nuclease-related domain-containing protein [Gammaproteobacteria bacterium]
MSMFKKLRDVVRGVLCRIWKSGEDFVPAFVLRVYSRHEKSLHKFKRDFCRSYKEIWDLICGRRKESPIKKGPLPRPGGRLKLEFFKWEAYSNHAVMLCVWPGVFFSVLLLLSYAPWLVYLVLLSTVIAMATIPVFQYRAKKYALGYRGERAVGEELDKLGRPQWRVFHGWFEDRAKVGDIDHIVVCPKGVFFVETKTLRKDPKKPETLILKGNAICCVNEYGDVRKLDSPDPIERTDGSARMLYWHLSQIWSDEKGRKMPYIARIFAFPGWSIDNADYSGNLILCNPEDIGRVFDSREEKLSAEQITKICAALERKNRADISEDL